MTLSADELVARATQAMADAEEHGHEPTAAAVRVVVEACAELADGFKHEPTDFVDTGNIWRTGTATAIARLLRALAPEPPR